MKKTVSDHSNKERQLNLTELGWRAFEAHQKCHGQHVANIIDRLGLFSLSQVATALVLLEVIEDVIDERLERR